MKILPKKNYSWKFDKNKTICENIDIVYLYIYIYLNQIHIIKLSD